MAFPSSPTNGQTATVNSISYVYNSTTNAWTRTFSSSPNLYLVGNVNAGNITANSGTVSTSTTTGALVVVGGVGVSGNLTAANVTATSGVNFSDGSRFTTAAVYDLDEIYPDSTRNSFQLKYNQSNISVTNPWNLLVTIDGIFQPAFTENYDTVWLSHALCASKGYTASSGNLKFAVPPAGGTTVHARTQPGSPTTAVKIYPFKPVDIVLGM